MVKKLKKAKKVVKKEKTPVDADILSKKEVEAEQLEEEEDLELREEEDDIATR